MCGPRVYLLVTIIILQSNLCGLSTGVEGFKVMALKMLKS